MNHDVVEQIWWQNKQNLNVLNVSSYFDLKGGALDKKKFDKGYHCLKIWVIALDINVNHTLEKCMKRNSGGDTKVVVRMYSMLQSCFACSAYDDILLAFLSTSFLL